MTTKSTRLSAEDKLVEDIVALMKSNDLPPWRKPWSAPSGEHRNLLTNRAYCGTNPLLLELGLLMHGSELPLWCGASQAKAEGWCPKKGSRAVRIVRPQLNKREQTDADGKPVVDSNGDAVVSAWVSYKPVAVFNANDLKGMTDETQVTLDARIKQALGDAPVVEASVRLEKAEAHLETWEVPVTLGGTRACYSSSLDRISLPKPECFTTRENYCSTWLHEQAHSTGHHTRLNRPLGNRFGSPAYAKEELIAELASVLACYRLRIGYEIEQHSAYLKSWASALKEGGAKELFKILSLARQSADLIAPEPVEAVGFSEAQACDAMDDEQDWLSPNQQALA